VLDVALVGGVVELRNSLGLDQHDDGVSPRRLPEWTRPQIPDLFVEAMVRMGSGVRVAFRTDSPLVELVVLTTSFRGTDEPPRTLGFDLVVDDEVRAQETISGGNIFVLNTVTRAVETFEPGEPLTLRWDDLGSHAKNIEIWLPTAATTELRTLRVADGARVEASTPSQHRRWVHHGSSISHCMEVVHPTETWPAIAARRGGVELTNLALAGQCHLDPYVARTIRDLRPDLVSLKVGINVINMDSMKERIFTPALHGFVDTIREANPTIPFVIASPIYCPSAEDHPGPTVPTADGKFRVIDGPAALREGSLTLRRVRQILSGFVAQRRDAGDANLHYLDGLELFGAAEVDDLPDDLHPNPAGYARMGERFADYAFTRGAPFAPQ
jgi:hypothetical protein